MQVLLIISFKICQKVCLSWESSGKYFPKEKIVLTGNTIRQEVINVKNIKSEKNKIPIVYITGGSAGAHAINLLVEEALGQLLQKCSVVHQTGGSEVYKDFERLEKQKSDRYDCQKFLIGREAAVAMSRADLVVGRAGMNTVTELIYLQKPAFLIPLPAGKKMNNLRTLILLRTWVSENLLSSIC